MKTWLRTRWAWWRHDLEVKVEGWWLALARRLPRRLRYAVVVVSAVDATSEYPGDATVIDVMRSMEPAR